MSASDMIMMAMMMQQQNQTSADARAAREFQQNLLNQASAKADAETARLDKIAADRKAAGESGRAGYVANVQTRLSQGLIGEEAAQKLVEDYYTKYDLAPDAGELSNLSKTYQDFAPKRREADINAVYSRLFKRAPSATELQSGQSQLSLGRTIGDLEEDLKSTEEYTKSRPGSAYEAEMEALYGGPVLDASGKRTGKYTLDFTNISPPSLTGNLAAKTGIATPSFIGKSFTGSAAEIDAAKNSLSTYENFIYTSGLKNLQGDIDKEINKYANDKQLEMEQERSKGSLAVAGVQGQTAKDVEGLRGTNQLKVTQEQGNIDKALAQMNIEGQKTLAKRQQEYGLLSNLVGSFNF